MACAISIKRDDTRNQKNIKEDIIEFLQNVWD